MELIAFNRTSLELKLIDETDKRALRGQGEGLLIEPVWN